MKAYKVFRVEDGRLFSATMERKACIEYSPRKKSVGKIFYNPVTGEQIRLPIIACKDLISAQKLKNKSYGCVFEIWEVEGKKSPRKLHAGHLGDIESGIYRPVFGFHVSRGTVFLSTCTPIRRVDVS